jgi:predicted N-acetyltransferase YhbS
MSDTTKPLEITILPATHADVPAMAKISANAFEDDRNTIIKNLGQVPYNMEAVSRENLPKYIDSEKCVMVKAMDAKTGELLGYAAWGFRGFEKDDIPVVEGAPENNDKLGYNLWGDKAEAKPVEKEEAKVEKEAVESEGIKRLKALQDADMTNWMQKLMPEGTRCIFVASLTVSPKHYRRGVGTALLKYGIKMADEKSVFIWAHSSMGAVRAYESTGFKRIGSLDMDLDEYAPRPPTKEEEPTGKWGSYSLVYLKYEKEKA